MLVVNDEVHLDLQARDCPPGASKQQDLVSLGKLMWSMTTGRPFLAVRQVSAACLTQPC